VVIIIRVGEIIIIKTRTTVKTIDQIIMPVRERNKRGR
jgi:hypothetical protein